jgi:hypothetical protein
MTDKVKMCECCEEAPARLRITVADMDGTLRNEEAVCLGCAEYRPGPNTVKFETCIGAIETDY